MHRHLIYFCFYWINRNNYKNVFDVGANIGLHSIILCKFGYEVYAFEPDRYIYEMLLKNIVLNKCKNIHPYCKAISNRNDIEDFIRVKGNLTASHIVGSRDHYGEIDHLKVETMKLQDVGVSPDLMKINIEGYEKVFVPSIHPEQWNSCDAFISIHDQENRKVLYDYFKNIQVNIFSQKIGWRKVEKIKDVPGINKEGLVFVSKKHEMPWRNQEYGQKSVAVKNVRD